MNDKVHISGPNSFLSGSFTEIADDWFDIKYVTFWEEHIFVSDHRDSPKVRQFFLYVWVTRNII